MIKKKNIYMANFNCTFGENNKPMLSYFYEIVYPAFTNGYIKETKGKNRYFFKDVELVEYKDGKYAIAGVLVKKTVLEVKSIVDDETGKIIPKNDKIPSDPITYFVLFLENHRMVLLKNQNGSPTLKDFESMSKFALTEAMFDYCKRNEMNELDKKVVLNVTSLPAKNSVEEELENVKSIESVTLKFYPLNADIDGSSIFEGLRKELDNLKSDEGYTTIKKPKDKDVVIDMLSNTRGLVEPKVRVIGANGEPKTITTTEIAEKIPVYINEDLGISENMNHIIEIAKDKEDLHLVSEENASIYANKIDIIKYIFFQQVE